MNENHIDFYYHGSSIDLDIGDYILPPLKTNKISEKGRKKNLDKVFFTKNEKLAKIYAGRAKNSIGGEKFIYTVKPIGDISVLSSRDGATVYMSDKAIITGKKRI